VNRSAIFVGFTFFGEVYRLETNRTQEFAVHGTPPPRTGRHVTHCLSQKSTEFQRKFCSEFVTDALFEVCNGIIGGNMRPRKKAFPCRVAPVFARPGL
jgi:hypothetical protein